MGSPVRRAVGGGLVVVLAASLGAADPVPGLETPSDVVYRYDERGQLGLVTTPWQAQAATYEYDEAGNLLAIDRQVPRADAATAAAPVPVSAPVVSAFTPPMARPGDVVTVTGAHFTGDPLLDTVMVGDRSYTAVDAAAPDELSVRVPASAATGRLGVATPAGTGQSSADLFVIPWDEVELERVTTMARVEPGSPALVEFSADNSVGLLAFDGVAGERIGLTTAVGEPAEAESACRGLRFGLSGPAGVEVVGRQGRPDWCDGGEAAAVRLPVTGTYTLLVMPDRRVPDGPVTVTLTRFAELGPPVTEALPGAPVAAPEPVQDGAELAPVDLATGELVLDHTDLLLHDVVALPLTRGQGEAHRRSGEGPFGSGWQLGFTTELALSSALQFADVVLPAGGRSRSSE